MKDLTVQLRNNGVIDLATIRYQEEITVSIKELVSTGIIDSREELTRVSEAKLKEIAREYREKRVPGIKKVLSGGKHASHRI